MVCFVWVKFETDSVYWSEGRKPTWAALLSFSCAEDPVIIKCIHDPGLEHKSSAAEGKISLFSVPMSGLKTSKTLDTTFSTFLTLIYLNKSLQLGQRLCEAAQWRFELNAYDSIFRVLHFVSGLHQGHPRPEQTRRKHKVPSASLEIKYRQNLALVHWRSSYVLYMFYQ